MCAYQSFHVDKNISHVVLQSYFFYEYIFSYYFSNFFMIYLLLNGKTNVKGKMCRIWAHKKNITKSKFKNV